MQTTFEITARSLNVSAKSFEALAYTGGTLRLPNFQYPVVVDLARLQLGKSLIANLDHDATKRVGHIPASGVRNDGRQLWLTGYLSANTEWREEVLASYREGFVWQASIEAGVDDGHEVGRGRPVSVNGRDFTGPLFIAAATLKGLAFVSHGADDNTVVSIAARRAVEPYTPEPILRHYATGYASERPGNQAPRTVSGHNAW